MDLMLARYRAVYAIHTMGVPDGPPLDAEIASQTDPQATARLVSDPLDHLIEHFASDIIKGQILNVFVQDCPEEKKLEPRNIHQLAQQKAAALLNENSIGFAYLVVDGSFLINTDDLKIIENDQFSLIWEDSLPPSIRNKFSNFVERVLGAIQLHSAFDNPPRVIKLCTTTFLIDQENDRPIYLIEAKLNGSMYAMRRLTVDHIADLCMLASALPGEYDPMRSVQQLNHSAEQHSDPLRNFFSAWMAIEMFVGGLFAKKYEPELRDGIRKAAHSMPKKQFGEFYGRLHWNFMEKFTIIATSLNVTGAVEDISLVKRLKDARDALTHRGVATHGELPTEATQQLARKYLRLYYMSQQPLYAERSLAGNVPPVSRSRSKPGKPRRLTRKP